LVKSAAGIPPIPFPGSVMIGGIAFPPSLILTGIVVAVYMLKKLSKALWRAYLTTKKLSKWRKMLADPTTSKKRACFVSTGSWKKRGRC